MSHLAARALLVLGLALALAGCPITPPRIREHTVVPASEAFIRVGTGCPTTTEGEPSFELTAQLFDSNNLEPIVARWFVNYDSTDPVSVNAIGGDLTIPGPTDTTVFERELPDAPFGRGSPFRPYRYRPPINTGTLSGPVYNEPGTIRIVELLVSNSFKSGSSSATNREASANFEVAAHRWVFLLVPGTDNCGPHPIP
jgi:hypothetical protein